MKPWRGKDFEYLNCEIKRKKDGYLYAYDKNGNQICRVWNINHGSITDVKLAIERYVHKYIEVQPSGKGTRL